MDSQHGLVAFDRFRLGATGSAADLERRIGDAVALLPGLPPTGKDTDIDSRTVTVGWLLGLSSTSRNSYFLALADFLFWCVRRGRDPLRARRVDTDRWKAQLTAQRPVSGGGVEQFTPAPNTVRKKLAALSSWYRYLQANDLAVVNPAARTSRPKRPTRSRYPTLTAGELRDFLAWLRERAERIGNEAAWLDAAVYHLMFHTGLRTAPVTQARFDDLGTESDGDRVYPVLRYIKKGGEPDWVPLPEDVLTVLDRYREVRAAVAGVAPAELTGLLFVTTPHPRRSDLIGGKRLQQNRMFDHLRVLARQAGLSIAETITLHSTRRTAGTLALAAGATLEQVQDLLGHADPRTTRDGYDATRHRLATSPVHTIAAALAEQQATGQ